MTLNRIHAEWLALAFFMILVGVVFHQAGTDLVEQGIAGGDAFHNAASYPRAVAVLIAGAVVIRVVTLAGEIRGASRDVPAISVRYLSRPTVLLLLFGSYIYLLGLLGYHLATAPFIALVMVLCGDRKPVPTIAFSVALAFLIAFLFERYLKIVLPGGVFSLNVHW